MQRINWIDWAKAWCMTMVVFEHTPHDTSPFLLQFLVGTNLASFFFISGYLKKPIKSQKEALKKYTYCLLIPIGKESRHKIWIIGRKPLYLQKN